MSDKPKGVMTIYPEFGSDWKAWGNPIAPAIDAKLVKELEDIARRTDGNPIYRVRWGCDCYEELENLPEINENGLLVGIEKGGYFHDEPLCIFDYVSGYKYKDKNGREIYLPAKERQLAPDGVILEEIQATKSIGVPRWRVEFFVDQIRDAALGLGFYITLWHCQELSKPFLTPEGTLAQRSLYRPFSRIDVEMARNRFNERSKLTKTDIQIAIEKQEAEKLRLKINKINQQREEDKAMVDQFFRDKEYKRAA